MKPSLEPRPAVMPSLVPHLAGAIGFWRGQRKMTQGELAQASGLSVSEVKWLERGRKNAPRLDTLEKICKGLDITLWELLSVAAHRALVLVVSVPVGPAFVRTVK